MRKKFDKFNDELGGWESWQIVPYSDYIVTARTDTQNSDSEKECRRKTHNVQKAFFHLFLKSNKILFKAGV